MLGGALLMRFAAPQLSRANKDVKLYDMAVAWESAPGEVMPLEVETYYGQGGTRETIAERYEAVQALFRSYSTVAGALIGLVIDFGPFPFIPQNFWQRI